MSAAHNVQKLIRNHDSRRCYLSILPNMAKRKRYRGIREMCTTFIERKRITLYLYITIVAL